MFKTQGGHNDFIIQFMRVTGILKKEAFLKGIW